MYIDLHLIFYTVSVDKYYSTSNMYVSYNLYRFEEHSATKR